MRLQLRRRVAYLVQEEAAALGLGKISLAGFVGTGKRPAGTAKQAGGGQALGNGRHIDADHGTAGAGARPVDRRGHQFLAGTGLSANQHIQVTGRHLLDVLPQMRHVATTPAHPVITDRWRRVRPALLRESQQQHHRMPQQQGNTLVQLGLGQCYFTLQLAPGYPAAAGGGQTAQQHALTIGRQGERLSTHVGLIQGTCHQFPATLKGGAAPPEYPGSLARGQGGQNSGLANTRRVGVKYDSESEPALEALAGCGRQDRWQGQVGIITSGHENLRLRALLFGIFSGPPKNISSYRKICSPAALRSAGPTGTAPPPSRPRCATTGRPIPCSG